MRFVVTSRAFCFVFNYFLARRRITIFILNRLVGGVLFHVFLPVSFFYSGILKSYGDERGQYIVS